MTSWGAGRRTNVVFKLTNTGLAYLTIFSLTFVIVRLRKQYFLLLTFLAMKKEDN